MKNVLIRKESNEEKRRNRKCNAEPAEKVESIWDPSQFGLQSLDPSDGRIDRSKAEGSMDPYEVLQTIPSCNFLL